MRGYHRQTKIVVTVGPATESSEQLRQSIVSGTDLIRLRRNEKDATHVRHLVFTPGKLGSRRHINLCHEARSPQSQTNQTNTNIIHV